MPREFFYQSAFVVIVKKTFRNSIYPNIIMESGVNFNEEDKMFQFEIEQKVCEVGGVKFGGQPGEYPCVCVNSIFQKGDRVFKGKRKEEENKGEKDHGN